VAWVVAAYALATASTSTVLSGAVTNLVMQNSVERRDIGAASGASTLFRTVGSSIGVSVLGVLYPNGLTGTLTERLGGGQAAQVAGGTITPGTLSSLPETVRSAYPAVVTSGVTTAFLWAAVAAVLAVGVAWMIRETPLKGSSPVAEEKVLVPAEA
jgi:hypothetical protein